MNIKTIKTNPWRMDNKALRHQAYLLYRPYRWRLCLMAIARMAAISWLSLLLQTVTGMTNSVEISLLNLLISLVTAPLEIGWFKQTLGLWSKTEPGWSSLFSFYGSRGKAVAAIACSLAQTLPLQAWGFIVLLIGNDDSVGLSASNDPVLVILAILLLLVAIAAIWVELRFCLAGFQMAQEDSLDVRALLKGSFRTMHGRVWRLIGFSVATGWWLMLAQFIALIVVGKYVNAPVFKLLGKILVSALACIIQPYVFVSMAGYALKILHNKDE